MMKVLITGGLGFIGSAIVPRFLGKGCRVQIVDNLEPTVHGNNTKLHHLTAPWLLDVELIIDSVTRRNVVEKAVCGVDAIVHLAGLTSIPESLREPSRYIDVNITSTALLCELARTERVAVFTLVSSRAVYGEGPYQCDKHGACTAVQRSIESLTERRWDPECKICRQIMTPQKVSEECHPYPVSVYGITKLAQEHLVETTRWSPHRTRTTILRLQNVYGPGQCRSVPDVGIANVLARQVLCGETVNLFEDGRQIRDFVFIDDVADLIVKATLEGIGPEKFSIFNVGTEVGTTLAELSGAIYRAAGKVPSSRISGEYRIGDVRHSVADMGALRARIGWDPVPLKKGAAALVEWLRASSFV